MSLGSGHLFNLGSLELKFDKIPTEGLVSLGTALQKLKLL